MANQCCVSGCASTKPDVRLYCFPRSEKRQQLWLRALNDPSLYKLTSTVLKHKRRVCHKHFEAKHTRQSAKEKIVQGARISLVVDACPTLFSKKEIESGIQDEPKFERILHLNTLLCRTHHLFDHSYTFDPILATSTPVAAQEPVCAAPHETDHTYCSQIDGKRKENKRFQDQEFAIDKKVVPPHGASIQSGDTTIANDIQTDHIDTSPRSSPHREDTPSPLDVPNTDKKFEEHFGMELKPSIEGESSKKHATNPNNAVIEGYVSGVFRHVAAPEPQLVKVARAHFINKLKTAPVKQPMKNKPNAVFQFSKYRPLPACCRKVYEKCNSAVANLKKKLSAQRSAARQNHKESFEFVTSKMPLLVRTFVRMQADMIKNKKTRGYRFKEDQKLLCLALYRANPAAYRFMSAIFTMPSRRTVLNIFKAQAAKANALGQGDHATKASQEYLPGSQTQVKAPAKEPELPNLNGAELSAAIATIAPPAPAPVPATPSETDPAHAELIAELARCLPAAPKVPKTEARTDARGRFIRRTLNRPRGKTTPSGIRKPQTKRTTTIRVFKLAAGTTCEDVVSHVSAIVPHHLVKCRKIVTKMKGPAFVLEVPMESRRQVLDQSFWPEGVATWSRGARVPVETKLAVRVFNVAEGTPVSDMIRHVSQVVPEEKITCERLDGKKKGESFKIAMPKMYLGSVADPSFWPDGVGVARTRIVSNPRKGQVKRKIPIDPLQYLGSKRFKYGGKLLPSMEPI